MGSWPLWPWPLTLTFCMDITSVIGNHSWKFHDDTMRGTLWKRCHRRTDGQTEIAVLRAAWSQLKMNREPLLCCIKLCASFHSHQWIQTGVTVRKCQICIKIDYFCPVRVTLKFDGWPKKTIGHLFYAVSSFMHHFIVISEFITGVTV